MQRTIVSVLVVLSTPACERADAPVPSSASAPIHLEEHLQSASLEGSEIPEDLPAPVEWRSDVLRSNWRAAEPMPEGWDAVKLVYVDGALRLLMSAAHRNPWLELDGTIYVDLPDWNLRDWAFVEIEARSSNRMSTIGLSFNYTEEDAAHSGMPFYSGGDRAPLVGDGQVHTYRLSLDSYRMRPWEGPWTHLAFWVTSEVEEESIAFDVLSVRVIPREWAYAAERVGVRMEARNTPAPERKSIFLHAPGELSYSLRVPKKARLDVGLGVVRRGSPVTFAITARRANGENETLLEEVYADPELWAQRSVGLAHLGGEAITLVLSAKAVRAGNVAVWATPTISGARATNVPNVVFYVIDGAGADYMSVYGYPRRTTPNLERLASEGAIFERAHSNSSWTRPSTASFLTSLQHSVLGGLRHGMNPVPQQVLTLAEHLHRTGYQTAEFTANPNAGRVSNLDRGLDYFREAGVVPNSLSSVKLHENFWKWREEYPGEPYYVHFQTTDVHNDHTPTAPFAGLFIDPERRRVADSWLERVNEMAETKDFGVVDMVDRIGVDQVGYWSRQRDLHDETMAHQDYQLGRLVARLKATGEWRRTLLIVAGDHSVAAGSWDYHLLTRDPQPPRLYFDDAPMLRSGVSRVPLIFVWPGHIAPGQHFRDPVSMIDMLPTILDLLQLPMPEVMMGRSLAPLLLGAGNWRPQPVVLDEFEVDVETGEWHGRIEVIDGRWGASLEVNPDPEFPERRRRPAPLLVYDLWNDPEALESLHEERRDLVEKYTAFLEKQMSAHRALAERFTPSEGTPLTPEQLRTLRSLGYVQ